MNATATGLPWQGNQTENQVPYHSAARTWPEKIFRGFLIGMALSFFTLVLLLPLAVVGVEALERGWTSYLEALTAAETLHALSLTLLVVSIVLPLQTFFGLLAAWALGKFEFRGKRTLITLIDLPFSVSPVVAGLIYVLLFGAQGWWGSWLMAHDIKVIFALPGIILATLFVTFPFVVRAVLPLMETEGRDAEEAALLLGASGWQCFWHVSLPQIRWALLHGMVLCAARAMGEFGAVSVVSGHIRGLTNTLPLHVEILYNEYQFTAAFAAASLLLLFSLVTLALKRFFERKMHMGGA